MSLYRPFVIALLFILSSGKLLASHFYGVDMYYTHISGNTYRVSIAAFGDCSGEQFPSFKTVRPKIYIRKGGTDVAADFLDLELPKEGIEVTPVCPAELNNTTCVNPTGGTVPGVKKFVYSKEFTLSGPASDWKFVFLGETDGSTTAGRSFSLTNVSPAGIIQLEATLNNTQFSNSSPVFTTIATPFYCINRPVNFNPGAVDANGDSLVYELVPALDPDKSLQYVPGFTPSDPLQVTPGAFSFSKSTGQLSFTPNDVQKSLVVYRVFEYRNGVLIGTSMREMTVVIMPCTNNPPKGYVTNATGASFADSVTVTTCRGGHELAFDINPGDADNGHIINMVANGLPKDAKLEITDNNTANPKSRFVWNMPDLPMGTHTFFVTYTDNGCPIASRQTQAYTIRIVPDSISSGSSPAECIGLGLINISTPSGWSPWDYQLYQGGAKVSGRTGITTNRWSDSILPGKYRVEATNYYGCTAESTVEILFNCYLADIPTAFTPNGDGVNDILYVIGKNVQEMHLNIYNRWGQLVFETHDINIGWDGKYNATDAPMEAYAYVLSIVFRNNEVLQKHGNITLIR